MDGDLKSLICVPVPSIHYDTDGARCYHLLQIIAHEAGTPTEDHNLATHLGFVGDCAAKIDRIRDNRRRRRE